MEIQKQRDRESQRHEGGGETNRAPRFRERHGSGIWGGLGCPERKRDRMAFSWFRVVCKTPLPRSYAGI